MLKDVRDGYVSAAAACSLYGVVLAHGGRSIDLPETLALRQRMRAAPGETEATGDLAAE